MKSHFSGDALRIGIAVAALLFLFAALPARAQEVPFDPATPPPAPPFAPVDYTPTPRVQPDPESESEIEVASQPPVAAPASPSGAASTLLPAAFHFPLIMSDHAPFMADRMGFGAGSRRISDYPNIRSLNAGLYLDWGARTNPPRPAGIEYVQMVRLHQVLTCPNFTTADRRRCPYANPPAYTYSPPAKVITKAAALNPGSLWLLGNEIDRPDWNGGGMDEMSPEMYAVAYHDLYHLIRSADPTARIAIGGVTQFTPTRRQYLDAIWNAYLRYYQTPIPVDVWNVHNFILTEQCRTERVRGHSERVCHGTGIPPGQNAESGAYVGETWRHVDMGTFKQQILDMRAWMRDKGQQNKPLMVSEYGVLYSSFCGQSNPTDRQNCIASFGPRYVDLEDPRVVQKFMKDTFEFFTTARDCGLSTVDDCRLVQQWVWFSLDWSGWFNRHGALVDPVTRQISSTGVEFSKFASNNWRILQAE